MTRLLAILCMLMTVALAATGCGDDATGSDKDAAKAKSSDSEPISSLIINGKEVGKDGRRADVPKTVKPSTQTVGRTARTTDDADAVADEEWPEPELLADGTIDDGADPFASGPIEVQPLPIEDDPSTTAAIDRWSNRLRRVDREQWDRWMDARLRSPWQQGADPILNSMVKVVVERCGGARTVATGIVLDDEIVVTTVHAIESPARRVRIASAFGASQHIPAMIRYLDVDDDIAVLKVPGLTATPMLFHVVTDDDPHWGYAYGISRGGPDGTVRRAPALVAMEASTVDLEQPDGFAERITDRSILPMVGAVDAGFSGGVIMATNDDTLVSGWGFHGLIRARVPYRANTGGIAVPAPLVGDALDASDELDEWYEHKVGACPQWHR